jgi:hypothetical protein
VNVLGDSSAGPPPRSAIEGSDDGLIACHVRSQVLLGDRGRDYCQESIGALGARLLLARLSPGYSSGGRTLLSPKRCANLRPFATYSPAQSQRGKSDRTGVPFVLFSRRDAMRSASGEPLAFAEGWQAAGGCACWRLNGREQFEE